MKIWLAGLAIICMWSLAGCAAKRPQAAGVYQYKRVGTQELLEPPGSTLPSAKNEILLHLGKARLGRIRGAACEVNAGSFHLRWNGSAADLRVITTHMVDGGDAARVPLSLLDDIDRFRAGLVALEANGCLRSGAAGPLLSRMMESLALPSRFAYFLRYGAAANLGYMDVEPPFRLKVMVPILKDGAGQNSAPSNVVGYETAWYVVAAKGRRFVPEAVEFYVKGQLQRSRKPSRAVVQLPDSLKYYRLFLLTRRSVSDHDILLLGSATKDGLERGTVAIKKDGHAACANLTCAQVPMDSSVSAELRVKARDQYVYVPLTGTVNDVLRTAGVRRPADVVKDLQITRPFGKSLLPIQFEAGKPDILNLVLIGGEELTWH